MSQCIKSEASKRYRTFKGSPTPTPAEIRQDLFKLQFERAQCAVPLSSIEPPLRFGLTNATDAPATQRAPRKTPESEALTFESISKLNQSGQVLNGRFPGAVPLFIPRDK